jgi:Cu(I)/Ag(I) efflux system membrane fusion protein
MDLIPLENEVGADEGPRTFRMSASSRALAEIQTTTVERSFPTAKVSLVGTLAYDETREKSLTARFPARIDRLFVNFTGITVKEGDHLAEVYSPELLTAQRELLTAYQANPHSLITRAAREKLRLWDLLPAQIDAILARGEATDRFVIKAPIGGVVVMKKVQEGDYVTTGEPLFRIVDLNELWAYLDAYESDLPWLRYGQEVALTVNARPGDAFAGKIAFIEPEVDRQTRTARVRVNVANPEGRLKPGMFVRGAVSSRLTANGRVYEPDLSGKWISPMHPEIVKDGPGQCDVCGMDLIPAEDLGYAAVDAPLAPITVPTSAVLRTGKRAVVYVERPQAERPTFDGREIVLGPRAGDTFIVAEGLETGERVVTNGAFKIDSALQIQAKPSMMNPTGGGRVPGHQHGDSEAAMSMPTSMELALNPDAGAQILPAYLALQAALARDDLAAAQMELRAMMEVTGHTGALPDLLHTMLGAADLEGLRKPHFETLSNALIAAAQSDPGAFGLDLLIMHCPMVYPDRGADWLQASEPLQNPYFGAMMLRCGEIEAMISPESEGKNHVH